jgi:molecular chaperone DnaK (HSP70)
VSIVDLSWSSAEEAALPDAAAAAAAAPSSAATGGQQGLRVLTLRPLATRGDARLGGDDFTSVVARMLDDAQASPARGGDADEALEVAGGGSAADSSRASRAYRKAARGRAAAEDVKHALTRSRAVHVDLVTLALASPPPSPDDAAPGEDFEITRREFELAARPLLARIEALIREVASEAAAVTEVGGSTAVDDEALSLAGVEQVVLVGGATRMPCVGRLVRKVMQLPPRRTVHPDHAVVLGAATHAALLDGRCPWLRLASPLVALPPLPAKGITQKPPI